MGESGAGCAFGHAVEMSKEKDMDKQEPMVY